jgi:hypothetical protein
MTTTTTSVLYDRTIERFANMKEEDGIGVQLVYIQCESNLLFFYLQANAPTHRQKSVPWTAT